jgi:hypothetical protein
MIFLMLLFLPGSLFAQDAAGRITGVSVSGLKRTRPQVAEQALQKFVGREAADLDLNEVKAAILDTGTLEPVSVEIADTGDGVGKIIRAEVLDKWSIFPVPIAFFGSGGMSVGAAFYDANAFGLNHKAVLMGAYQSDGWNVTGMYFKPPTQGRPGWSGSVSFSRNEREDADQTDDVVLRRFDMDSFNASGGASYKFTEFFSASLRLGYTGRFLQDSDEPIRVPESGAQVLRMGPEFFLRRSSWDGFLLSEKSASLSYNYMYGFGGTPSFHSLHFQGLYQKFVFPGFHADFRTGLLYEPDVPVLIESSSGEAAVNILPRSFSAQHYAGFSLGLEKYLFKIRYGTLSLRAAWQMVYSCGSILEDEFDYGVAGTLSFYLSRLAIPAVGIGVAYNIDKEYFQWTFSMGMSL